ncbi:MAG: proton-conducting transporter membrane subunit [Candidatus Melainabacteria bacterium]|nr:proton-conducting transporter membrane subunit [Candidatus Melainabacteria bacterium]
MNLSIAMSVAPLLAAFISLGSRNALFTRAVVPSLFFLQIGLIAYICIPVLNGTATDLIFSEDFSIDRIGAYFLLLTNFVVACAMSHAFAFFERESALGRLDDPNHERIFYASTALFLLAMSFVFICDNLGFLWVSIEATTLFSAALVYFSRDKHALEATWKYLIVCSVGIAFALLGTVLIFASSQHGAVPDGSLNIRVLIAHANMLQPKLLQLGYIFCLLGYGTKAGVAPLHSWLPDAHSEAPAPASAMLSGALLNCALYAIWRVTELMNLTPHHTLSTSLPIIWGAITALVASLVLVHQSGIKRLWAYSSIENVGIMLVAIGMSSPLLFFLQALNHSVAKVCLFLISGNIIQTTGTKELAHIHGVLKTSPVWGILFAIAALAVTGAPPFGAFICEWMILSKGADAHSWIAVIMLIIALTLSFIAVSVHVGKILLGTPKQSMIAPRSFGTSFIPFVLCVCALLLGVTFVPSLLVNPL